VSLTQTSTKQTGHVFGIQSIYCEK